MFEPTGRSRASIFDPAMVALLKENDRLTPKGDEGVPDYDVICSCQDDDGMKVQGIVVAQVGANAATATVDLRFSNDHTSLKFDLVQVGGQWRIHDIHTKDTPSLRGLVSWGIQDNLKYQRSRH